MLISYRNSIDVLNLKNTENKFKIYDKVSFYLVIDNKKELLTGTIMGFCDHQSIEYIILLDKELIGLATGGLKMKYGILKAIIIHEKDLTLIES